jgi:hypothetical protein
MKRVSILSLLLATLCACGGPKTTDLSPRSSEETIKNIPKWFLDPETDDDHLHANASGTSRDLQVALNKARTMAQADLAQQLGTRLGNLTRQFSEEVGMEEDSQLLSQFNSATKAVTDQSMSGARVDRQELVSERQIYRAYVHMSLPIGRANQLLMDKIRSNQQLYTRLRATQAYADLDRELEALNADENRAANSQEAH